MDRHESSIHELKFPSPANDTTLDVADESTTNHSIIKLPTHERNTLLIAAFLSVALKCATKTTPLVVAPMEGGEEHDTCIHGANVDHHGRKAARAKSHSHPWRQSSMNEKGSPKKLLSYYKSMPE